MIILVAVGGIDGVNTYLGTGHQQSEIPESGSLSACLQSETKFVEFQTGMIRQSETFEVHVERIVGQSLQNDVGTDILHVHVMQIEEFWRRGDVMLIILYAGTADD